MVEATQGPGFRRIKGAGVGDTTSVVSLEPASQPAPSTPHPRRDPDSSLAQPRAAAGNTAVAAFSRPRYGPSRRTNCAAAAPRITSNSNAIVIVVPGRTANKIRNLLLDLAAAGTSATGGARA
jgi:hypothetical protein